MRCSADHLNQVGRHNAISRLRILIFSTRRLAPLYPIRHVPLIPTLHSGGAANVSLAPWADMTRNLSFQVDNSITDYQRHRMALNSQLQNALD